MGPIALSSDLFQHILCMAALAEAVDRMKPQAVAAGRDSQEQPLNRDDVIAIPLRGRSARALIGGRSVTAIVTFSHQPIGDTKGQRHCGQSEQLSGVYIAQIDNDELSSNCQQRDQQHDLGLNNALFALDHVLKRVIELQRNQQRQRFAKHRLKRAVVKRIERTQQQAGHDSEAQSEERDEDDKADDESED